MDTEAIFGLLNLFILPGWLLLSLAPRWRWTNTLVMSGLYSSIYAIAYIVLLGMALTEISLDFSSLASVASLFQNSLVLLAGWAHYLAFDLFIAGWMLKDSQLLGRSHVVMLPILALTFYVGPMGFALYMVSKRLTVNLQAGHLQ